MSEGMLLLIEDKCVNISCMAWATDIL